MGKKRVIKKTEEELIKEAKQVTEAGGSKFRVSSKKKIAEGRIYIYSSYNNTIMTLTDEKGNVLFGASAGRVGFKGAKKSTPFAASKIADAIAQAAQGQGMNKVRLFVKGIGSGRDSAIRTLGTKGLEFLSIKDITPIPHNGPRMRRPRRV